VVVYVGSIMDPHPQTIGNIAIPRAFYKVVIDPATKEVIGFMMNNQNTPKGDMTRYITTISKIEEQSGITFTVPEGTDKTKNVALWHTSTSHWRKQHKALCKGK
jgi:endonuclease G